MRRRQPHEHQYTPVDVDSAPVGMMHPRMMGAGPGFTYVLLRCDCGDVMTRKLEGKWTIDQIRGISHGSNKETSAPEVGPASTG
jgi:hypothetical protein